MELARWPHNPKAVDSRLEKIIESLIRRVFQSGDGQGGMLRECICLAP